MLSLLPKKGDLALLKNCRPVALLCTDYRMLSTAPSNELKGNQSVVVRSDKTYCAPDRTIMDNLFFIRDTFLVCRTINVNFDVVSLDQEKVFDRVDHSYLLSALWRFGFNDGFVSLVGLLYSGGQCMMKSGAGLSRPIPPPFSKFLCSSLQDSRQWEHGDDQTPEAACGANQRGDGAGGTFPTASGGTHQ